MYLLNQKCWKEIIKCLDAKRLQSHRARRRAATNRHALFHPWGGLRIKILINFEKGAFFFSSGCHICDSGISGSSPRVTAQKHSLWIGFARDTTVYFFYFLALSQLKIFFPNGRKPPTHPLSQLWHPLEKKTAPNLKQLVFNSQYICIRFKFLWRAASSFGYLLK